MSRSKDKINIEKKKRNYHCNLLSDPYTTLLEATKSTAFG